MQVKQTRQSKFNQNQNQNQNKINSNTIPTQHDSKTQNHQANTKPTRRKK